MILLLIRMSLNEQEVSQRTLTDIPYHAYIQFLNNTNECFCLDKYVDSKYGKSIRINHKHLF